MAMLVSTQCHTHSQPACLDAEIPGQELIHSTLNNIGEGFHPITLSLHSTVD